MSSFPFLLNCILLWQICFQVCLKLSSFIWKSRLHPPSQSFFFPFKSDLFLRFSGNNQDSRVMRAIPADCKKISPTSGHGGTRLMHSRHFLITDPFPLRPLSDPSSRWKTLRRLETKWGPKVFLKRQRLSWLIKRKEAQLFDSHSAWNVNSASHLALLQILIKQWKWGIVMEIRLSRTPCMKYLHGYRDWVWCMYAPAGWQKLAGQKWR